MIAKNYIKYPEALRFQVELFSNGYKNSPRIMRLMTVIFDWKTETPEWLKSARTAAKLLVKHWKKLQVSIIDKLGEASINSREAALQITPKSPR